MSYLGGVLAALYVVGIAIAYVAVGLLAAALVYGWQLWRIRRERARDLGRRP